jgi:Cu+-exporting ATPase
LIRGADYLERAVKLTTVVFDKTGTLTRGEPAVTDAIATGDAPLGHDAVLRLAAAAERGSEHPLGQAIVRDASHSLMPFPPVDEFAALPGRGVSARVEGQVVLLGNRHLMEDQRVAVDDRSETWLHDLEGQGKTAMLVAVDGTLVGIIAVADTLKAGAADAVDALRAERVTVAMLTGDNDRTARAIAEQVGIDRVIANVLPADKAREVQRLRDDGEVVAMVGDGVNDAPALATADIGIAIGSGSDVAKETGGIILVKDDLSDVAIAIRLSRATMRKIKQNLFWAFGYNAAAIPIAALGLLNPIIAAAAMALSSLSVIANSATLKGLRVERLAAPRAATTRTPPRVRESILDKEETR